jgi:prepilin-type N-terminal cleavage/methylation domain-containing protein
MTAIARVLHRRRSNGNDGGYTLTELLVSMGIFALLLALVAAATTTMFKSLWKQTGQTDNLDNSRKVIALLDKQVRYANAINTPGTGSDGNFYVDWRSGNQNQQQTCYQWRLVLSSKQLQYRTWQPPLFSGTTPAASSWVTVGTGVTAPASTPLFSITPPTSALTPSHEYLTISFVSTHGNPAKSTTNKVSLTGANTTSSAAPSTAVCQEHGRPTP